MLPPRTVRLTLGFWLALVPCTSLVRAQATKDEAPAADAPATKAQQRGGNRPMPWDDPAMQLRMLRMRVTGQGFGGFGGRGGRGGPGGPGGGPGGDSANPLGAMISILRNNKPLQEELKLSEAQVAQLKKIDETVQQRRGEFFQQMRNNAEGFDRQAMGEMMATLGQESQAASEKVLSAKQKQRLIQIALRIEGPTAVAREDVATRLNMSPVQMARIQEIMEGMKAAQEELSMAQRERMGAFFGRGPGGGGPGGGGPAAKGQRARQPQAGGEDAPAAKEQQPPQGGPNGGPPGGPNGGGPNGGGRQRPDFTPEQREQMQKEMKKAGDEQDRILQSAEKQIGAVLTARQKKTFNSLLGPEFDISLLAQQPPGPPGGGGPGGPGGPGAPPARGARTKNASAKASSGT